MDAILEMNPIGMVVEMDYRSRLSILFEGNVEQQRSDVMKITRAHETQVCILSPQHPARELGPNGMQIGVLAPKPDRSPFILSL